VLASKLEEIRVGWEQVEVFDKLESGGKREQVLVRWSLRMGIFQVEEKLRAGATEQLR
jgi:hypothetical protein